jgi:hypothetical protein
VLHQRGVALQGRVQERVGRHEEHHEIRRLIEGRPVRLGRQRVHVPAQHPGVLVEVRVAGALVARLHGGQVRVEGRLRVDHHRAPAVQPHQHVRAYPLVVGRPGDLLEEIAMIEQPGRLDDAAQLMLAPATPDLRRAQRRDQLFRLGAELAGDRAHGPDLLAQLGVGVHPVPLQLGHPLLVAAQSLVQRRDRPGDRLLGLRRRFVRQRAQGLLQPALAVPAGLQGGLEPGDVGGGAQPGGRPAEGGADPQTDDHHGERREGHPRSLPEGYDEIDEGTVER